MKRRALTPRYRDPSTRPRKYGPGEPIATQEELVALMWPSERSSLIWVHDGSEAGGRAEHVAWTANRGFLLVRRLLSTGQISRVRITDDYRDWLRRELAEAETQAVPAAPPAGEAAA